MVFRIRSVFGIQKVSESILVRRKRSIVGVVPFRKFTTVLSVFRAGAASRFPETDDIVPMLVLFRTTLFLPITDASRL